MHGAEDVPVQEPSQRPSEGVSDSQDPNEHRPRNRSLTPVAPDDERLTLLGGLVGFDPREFAYIYNALEAYQDDAGDLQPDRPDRADDVDQDDQGDQGDDREAFPTETELETALENLPEETREALERFDETPSPEKSAYLSAYGENIEPPERGTCGACGADIRTGRIALGTDGEDLLVMVCDCRIWTNWDGPEDNCPVCAVHAREAPEVIHTHEQPCVRYATNRFGDTDPLTYRWADDEATLSGILSGSTVPDELERR